MILSIVDTCSIQSYVFGSNRLRENIGASYLVAAATGHWADEIAAHVSGSTATCLYAGGGNYLTRFTCKSHADCFDRQLSLKVLREAPGLQLAIAQCEYDAESPGALVSAVRTGFLSLDNVKASQPRSQVSLGISVTRTCRSTGLPAVGFRNEPGNYAKIEASAETLAKEDVNTLSDERLKSMFDSGTFLFPQQFEHLGRTFGDQSYIAVVHADGNGLGTRINSLANLPECADNDIYAERIQQFSAAVQECGKSALQGVINDLIGAIQSPGIYYTERLSIELAQSGLYLPFRPIVYGGDDLSFVCDGRLGLSLAVRFLTHFEAETTKRKDVFGSGLTACAGIAIVKSHHPFARAYALSEELCRSAKRYRKELQNVKEVGSCMDWQLTLAGVQQNLDQARSAEYTVEIDATGAVGSLNQRPVTIDENPQDEYRSWQHVVNVTHLLQSEDWSTRRSKWKELREALRGGPEAVGKFRELYGLKDSILATDGWLGSQCILFDAIELADLHIPVPLP